VTHDEIALQENCLTYVCLCNMGTDNSVKVVEMQL